MKSMSAASGSSISTGCVIREPASTSSSPKATRYRIVLSILFGLAASITRKTSNDENGAPVLLALDEAGNIPLHNLSEALGVGRGRKCGIVLGCQNYRTESCRLKFIGVFLRIEIAILF